jgi:hypothetical protein
LEYNFGTIPQISALLTQLAHEQGATHGPSSPPAPQPLIDTAVYATLLWEASSNQAKSALTHLNNAFVDFNDIRVAPVSQIVAALGERAPLATERALRLKAWLNDLFSREQRMDIEPLRNIKHEQAQQYLLGLDGAPPFVALHTLHAGLGAHTVAVDERLLTLLTSRGAVAADLTPLAASEVLAGALPAESLTMAVRVLRWWSDHQGHTPKRESDAFKPQPIAPLELNNENAPRRATRLRPREVEEKPRRNQASRSSKDEPTP